MKLLRTFFVHSWIGVLALCGLVLSGGCETLQTGLEPTVEPVRPDDRGITSNIIRPQEQLTIDLLDITTPQRIEQAVQDDGSITLPLISEKIMAGGRTVAELQDVIKTNYVPKFYRRLTVNIKRENRFYFVGGEVKNPSQRPYTGDMTVLRAIKSAGDFTDYADKKGVEIIRSNGARRKVNVKKIIDDPRKDIPIYPGDTVHVHRSIY